MRTWWISLALLACGAPRESLPNNVSNNSTVRIGPNDPLGWIGIATAPADTDSSTIAPSNADHPLVTTAERAVLPAQVNAIGSSGTPQMFVTGARTQILYGCDGNQLDVTAFSGPRLPPGVAWILPPSRPASWQPTPFAITSRGAKPAQRSYTIGSLSIDLVRTGDLRGTLTILRDGRVVHTAPFERQLMDGADPSPIDLAEGGPGIPDPIAAWSIADGGPILVVMRHPGYEGMSLKPLLVDATSARPIESMQTYLYHCAF